MATDLDAFSRLPTETLLNLPNVKDIHTSFSLGEVKAGAALPLTHLQHRPLRRSAADATLLRSTMTTARPQRCASRLADALLTTDPTQRLRLAQAGLAMVLMALLGRRSWSMRRVSPARRRCRSWPGRCCRSAAWSAFFVAIRSGWSRRLRRPVADACRRWSSRSPAAPAAYAMAGPVRGARLPGLDGDPDVRHVPAAPRQMAGISALRGRRCSVR